MASARTIQLDQGILEEIFSEEQANGIDEAKHPWKYTSRPVAVRVRPSERDSGSGGVLSSRRRLRIAAIKRDDSPVAWIKLNRLGLGLMRQTLMVDQA
jgi:hypothetical protein